MNLEDRASFKRVLRRDQAKMAMLVVSPSVVPSSMSVEVLVIPPMVPALMEEGITLPVVQAPLPSSGDGG